MKNKFYFRLLSKKYRFKEWFFNNITPHLPRIPVPKPEYFGFWRCVRCHSTIKIYAHHTGDGWMFFWDCEGQHTSDRLGDRSYIVGYFPFLFGWATGKDLIKIGIEVV